MNARLKSYTSSSRCGPPAGVCIVDSSFAPLGLVPIPLSTHGLRRGLHSYAASRLTRNFASLHASQSRSEGLVLKPEEWLWSSFRHYAYGERGPVLVNEIRNAEFHIRKISRSHRHRSPPVKPPRVGHPLLWFGSNGQRVERSQPAPGNLHGYSADSAQSAATPPRIASTASLCSIRAALNCLTSSLVSRRVALKATSSVGSESPELRVAFARAQRSISSE